MKHTASLFLILTGLVCGLQAAGDPSRYVDEKTGFIYPAAIGQALFQNHHAYDDPRLGYSVRYTSGDWNRIDVYYYDKGLPAVPEGCESPLMTLEMKAVMAEIRTMEKLGRYNQVNVLETGIRPDGSGNKGFLWLKISLLDKSSSGAWEGRFSETYLRGYKNGFFKIRLTYQSDHRQEGEELARNVAETFFRLLNPATNTSTKPAD